MTKFWATRANGQTTRYRENGKKVIAHQKDKFVFTECEFKKKKKKTKTKTI